jgi:hypothetical protein
MQRFHQVVLWLIPLLGGLVGVFSREFSLLVRIARGLLFVATASWMLNAYWRKGVGLHLSPSGVTSRGFFFTRSAPWTEIATCRVFDDVRLFGQVVTFAVQPGTSRREIRSPTLRNGAETLVREYLRTLGLQSLLRDRPPTVYAQFTTTELLEHDPVESLRSVRRAAVGDRLIRVRALTDGFRAETTDQSGKRLVRTGEVRATLAEATHDAIQHVAAVRAEG